MNTAINCNDNNDNDNDNDDNMKRDQNDVNNNNNVINDIDDIRKLLSLLQDNNDINNNNINNNINNNNNNNNNNNIIINDNNDDKESENELHSIKTKLINIKLLKENNTIEYINQKYQKLLIENEKLLKIVNYIKNDNIELNEIKNNNLFLIKSQINEITFLQSSLSSLLKEYNDYKINASNAINDQSNTINEYSNTINDLSNTINDLSNTINEQSNTINDQQNTINDQSNTINDHSNTINDQHNTINDQQNTINEQLKTINTIKKNLILSENMRSSIESSMIKNINKLTTNNIELNKQISNYKNDINNKWEKAFIDIKNKVIISNNDSNKKLKNLQKELLIYQDNDNKKQLKLDNLYKYLQHINDDISMINDISSYSKPDIMRADLRAISRSLNRLLTTNNTTTNTTNTTNNSSSTTTSDKSKQIPKILRSVVTFICNIINESTSLDEEKNQYSVDCSNKDQALEASSLLISNLKTKIQELETTIMNTNKIIHKSNTTFADILHYCNALSSSSSSSSSSFNRRDHINLTTLSFDSPIPRFRHANNDESIWDFSRKETDSDDDTFYNMHSKCSEDLQSYASAVSLQVKLITDEIERAKSSEKCIQGSYQDLQLQLDDVINRYELQLDESKNVHERELKAIWNKLRESVEKVENLKIESDEAIKVTEEHSQQKIEAYKNEVNNFYMEKMNEYEASIKNYESIIKELTIVKEETEFDLERSNESLDHVTFYFNHLLNQVLSSTNKRDDLIVQKRILTRNLNGFNKLYKNVHMLSLACSDPCCSLDDINNSLQICGSDGLPYRVPSLDETNELEYNPLYLNVLTTKPNKRPLPTLRVVAIVVLAAIRFDKLQRTALTNDYVNILPSLPPALSCKHLTANVIAEMVINCARKSQTYAQIQHDCDAIFLSYHSGKPNSPVKLGDKKTSLVELIMKQKKEKTSSDLQHAHDSLLTIEKVAKSNCSSNSVFWNNLKGIADIYGVSKLDSIQQTLITMSKNLRVNREREIELHLENLDKENQIESIQSKLRDAEKEISDQKDKIEILEKQLNEKNKIKIRKPTRAQQIVEDITTIEKDSAEKRLLGIYENIGRLSEKSPPKYYWNSND